MHKNDSLISGEELEKKLVKLIAENVLELPTDFDRESDLAKAGLDSMALMQLLILIENHFDLILAESDVSRQNSLNIRTLSSLIQLRLSQKAV